MVVRLLRSEPTSYVIYKTSVLIVSVRCFSCADLVLPDVYKLYIQLELRYAIYGVAQQEESFYLVVHLMREVQGKP